MSNAMNSPHDVSDLLAELRSWLTPPGDSQISHAEADRLLWQIILRLTDNDAEVQAVHQLFEDAELWYA